MKRVIFSLYIDIPEDELDEQPPYPGDDISKTLRTKYVLKENYNFLRDRQQLYADKCNINYHLYEYDNDYKDYENFFKTTWPFITSYNIVNFYKIRKLYDLAKEYDEILYLDFDVVPTRTDNFFESVDLTKGIAVSNNFIMDERMKNLNIQLSDLLYQSRKIEEKSTLNQQKGSHRSNRSPTAKYWNTMALNIINSGTTKSSSHNTGIIGVSSSDLHKLDYWEDFEEILEQMTELKEDDLFPDHIRRYFGWDNETIWGHKVEHNQVSTQELTDVWHYRLWDQTDIPAYVNFIHVLNKDFEFIKEWLVKNEKINL